MKAIHNTIQGKKRDIENELKKEKIAGLKIRYVVQENPLGTGHALKTAYSYLKEKILVLNGDDYYGAQEFKKVFSLHCPRNLSQSSLLLISLISIFLEKLTEIRSPLLF